MGMSVSPPQLLGGGTRMQRCKEPEVSVRVAPSIPVDASTEVCRAVKLSWQALNAASLPDKKTGARNATRKRADSIHVTRHDFPVLGSNSRRSLYQLGYYLAGPDYQEVVVDRASWKVEVQGR